MHFLSFALIYPLIWLSSRLPMRLLYGISNLLFFFVYHIFKYRKDVVTKNVRTAFPEKEDTEIKTIVKKFFLHFTDLLVESIKAFSISEKEILKRYTYKNPELVEKYIKEGKSIILTGAHQANWEWSFYLPTLFKIPFFGAYTKLANTYFNDKIIKSRTKFGGRTFMNTGFIKGMQQNHNQKMQAIYLLLSDQSPQLRKAQYWRDFFNINVPVHVGPEMLAKRFDYVFINYVTTKLKRGYFETSFELVTDTPKDFDKFQITDKYFEITERNIRRQPEYYLWSHKRFKHKNKYDKWLDIKKPKRK